MRPDLQRPRSRHPSVLLLAWWFAAFFAVFALEAIGLARWAAVLLVMAVAVIAYAWMRFRPQPS